MNRIFVLLLALYLSWFSGAAQIAVCSWNIQNFGKSKPDSTVHFIANQLRTFDVVAVIEVVAGNGGAQAIARLADELNRMGAKWDYRVSDPTFSTPGRQERYAYLWKPSRVKLIGKPWLDTCTRAEIEREPYMATFEFEKKQFTMACLHALPKKQQPERELSFLKKLPQAYKDKALIICGDFNCPQSHTVFLPLKEMAFLPAFKGQRTTLKTKCDSITCLASEYDNFFYDTKKITISEAGVIEFQNQFTDVLKARKVSDHLPITCRIFLK